MKKTTMGDRIRQLREDYSQTKADFAKTIGVAPLSVGNIERGVTQTFHTDTLNKIVSAYGTTREWLESGRGEMLPNGKKDITAPVSQPGSIDYKDEAWDLAREQIKKKDKEIEVRDSILQTLAISFDRVTKMMQDSGMSFLRPVEKTA